MVNIYRIENKVHDSMMFESKSEREIFTIQQLCKYLEISRVTLNDWRSNRGLKSKNVGKRVFFLKEDVVEFLKSF